jgi:hypothetical protein
MCRTTCPASERVIYPTTTTHRFPIGYHTSDVITCSAERAVMLLTRQAIFMQRNIETRSSNYFGSVKAIRINTYIEEEIHKTAILPVFCTGVKLGL